MSNQQNKGLMAWMENNFVPIAGKIGAQRHLVAIRDGFVQIMPLLLALSFAVLINGLPIPGWADWRNANIPWLSTINGNVWFGVFGFLAVFLVFAISANLAKSRGVDGIQAGLVSAAAFFIMLPQAVMVTPEGGEPFSAWGLISYTKLGTQGMLIALIGALVFTELFCWLQSKKSLIIKMPDGVPPAVARSFAAVFPGIIVCFVAAIVGMLFGLAGTDIFTWVFDTITKPMSHISNTLPSLLALMFFNHFIWFFGLHGANLLGGLIEPVLLQNLANNVDALAAGKAMEFIVTKPFIDTFVYMGGSGTTVGLLIAVLIGSKLKQQRDVAKLSIGPAFFNINEPTIFGLPIVLNVVYVIPFIVGPMILATIAYLATAVGIVPMTSVLVPWTMPPVLGAFLATGGSVMGGLVALINLAISIVIYLPFVYIANSVEKKKEAALGK